ncbi:hypothetical protein EPUL_005357, partial [Erysiphe pulchra]
MLLSLVKVALALIFVTITASKDLEQEQSILTQSVYYDCGSWVVPESRLQNFLHENGMYIDNMALPFIELLYGLKSGYRKMYIPQDLSKAKSIRRAKPGSSFYLIIDRIRQIVDVVAQMKNSHYIKCERVGGSRPESSNFGQNEYSYECGHELFSHEILKMNAELAQSCNGKNKQYLQAYQGPLYWPELDYSIYPLSRRKNEHYPGKRPENTYFVVISPTGEVIDVIAELKYGDFIKCARTIRVPPNIDSDENLHHGYLCGLNFFDLNHMERTAELAESRISHPGRGQFPKTYKDDSFEGSATPSSLIPSILCRREANLLFISVPHPIKHFIVMNFDFTIKFAAVKTPKGIIKPCEASTRGLKSAHLEADNFICDLTNTEFKNERLLVNVGTACKALGTYSRKYPADYQGPAFNVHGPYVTWPIRKENSVRG